MSARAASATSIVWLLGSALAGCSLLVDGELDGRDLGKKLGFAEGDGGKRARDGGDDEEGAGTRDAGGRGISGNGGRGGESGSDGNDAGDRAGPDDGVGMDGGSGMDGGAGKDSGASNLDSGEADAADGSDEPAPDGSTPAPLTITSATPAAGSSTTANVVSISVTFSEPVAAIGASDLQLRDGGGGLIAGTLGTDGATVTFTPTQPLRSIDTYKVSAGAAISASASGVTLGAAQQWTFAIVTGFANDAALIDLASTAGGSSPAVAVDADGNALAVWVQSGGAGASKIWHAFYRSGSGWGTASELDGRTGEAGPPSVAMTPGGTAFVAWTQAEAGGGYVLVRRYDPASGWDQPVQLDIDPDVAAASLSVGVGANFAGSAIVAWGRGADGSANGTGQLYFSLYDSGSKTWDAPALVQDENNNPVSATGDIQAAIAKTGFLAIGAFAFTDATIFVRGNAGWERPFRDYDYTSVRRMAVAVDASGAFYAGCHDPEGGGNEVARIVGTSAGALRNVAVGNSAYSVDPKFSMAADSDAVAAFLAVPNGATSTTVQALSYDTNVVDWAPNASDVFPNRGGLVPSQPDVTVYGTSALIAWEAGGNLYTVERAPTRSYSAAAMRSHVAGNVVADSVQVAAGNSGNGVIVWTEATTPPRIAAQTFRGVR